MDQLVFKLDDRSALVQFESAKQELPLLAT
jgi:hypothetical protein